MIVLMLFNFYRGFALCIFVYATFFNALAAQAEQELIPVVPRQAKDFEKFLGINLILTNNDYGFAEESSIFDEIVLPRMRELGIKNVRDATAWGNYTLYRHSQKLNALEDLGISFYLSTLPERASMSLADVAEEVEKINCLKNGCTRYIYNLEPVDSILGLIGPNETDHVASFLRHCENTNQEIPEGLDWYQRVNFCYAGWEERLLSYTQNLHSLVKSDQNLNTLKIVAPTLVNLPQYPFHTQSGTEANLWDLLKPLAQYTDYGSGNLYTWKKTHRWGAIPNEVPMRSSFFESGGVQQKLIVTEFGYYTQPLNEFDLDVSTAETQSKKMIVSAFDYFQSAQVEHAFIFELLDRPSALSSKEASFGILDSTGNPKPAFHTFKRTMELLKDTTSASQLTPLTIAVSESSGTVHSQLFLKSSGDYLLALWNDPNLETVDGLDRLQTTTINLAEDYNLSVYRPALSDQPLQVLTAQRTITLDVPDDLVIIKITSVIPDAPLPPLPPATCKMKISKKKSYYSLRFENSAAKSRITLQRKSSQIWKKVWRKTISTSKSFKFKVSRNRKYRITSSNCGSITLK
ncbi:hypothetical protein JNK13_02625 [bacterium]|nr:hypothetical protein [bacterium]